MADIERTLVFAAIASGQLGDVIGRGIEPDHFADEEVADVYAWAYDFHAEHHQPPTMEAIKDRFPHFKARISKEPLKYHMENFIHQVKERKATELLRDYFEVLEDPDMIDDIEMHALDMAQQLVEVVPAPRAAYLGRDALARYQRYKERQKTGDQPGIPIGVPSFDALTLGMQPHELMILAGPPGSGKTTSMQHSGKTIYLGGRSVLFVSLEVEAEQILRRFETMLSHVEYHALKALELVPEQEQRWLKILERCQKEAQEHDVIVRDDIKNCTPEKIAAERIRYKPGVVIVDYLEELRGRKGMSGWENVQENGRALKQQARTSKIPHITGTQVNREGETSYQSVRKIADCLITLIPPGDKNVDENDAPEEDEMLYIMTKYRDGPSYRKATMKWSLNTMDIEEKGVASDFPVRNKAERKRLNRLAKKNGQAKHTDNPYARKRGATHNNGGNPWARVRPA